MTDRGRLYGCDMMIPQCVDNRLTDGEVVSLTSRQRSTSQKVFPVSGTHFCQRLSKPQRLMWLEGLDKLKKKKKSITSSRLEPTISRLATDTATTWPHIREYLQERK
jgi:hypothetical protein